MRTSCASSGPSLTRPAAVPIPRAMNGTALLVVDMQRDLLEADGRLPVDQGMVTNLLAATNRAIRAAEAHGVPVVYIVNAFPAWDPGNLFRRLACIDGRPGADLDPRIARVEGETFTKRRGDAFHNRALEGWLADAGIARLVVAGVQTDACVSATVRGAISRGFAVTVLRDAVASTSERRNALGLIKCAETGARLARSAEFADECREARQVA